MNGTKMEVNRGYVIYLCRYELKNNHFSCQKNDASPKDGVCNFRNMIRDMLI